jgi:hypothetical protein
MAPRVHFRNSGSSACGRTGDLTDDEAAVTCKSCLKQIEISRRPPKSLPQIPPGHWHTFHSKIAGVSHQNDDGVSRQRIIASCRLGEELELVRDHHNPIDPNAVRILRRNGEQLGYVTAYLAKDLAPAIDHGTPIRVRISDLTGGGELTSGVNIEVAEWRGARPVTGEPWFTQPYSSSDRTTAPSAGGCLLVACIVVAIAIVVFVLK